MTSTKPGLAPSATSSGSPNTAAGAIVGFDAQDGVFLHGEHLNHISSYAKALSGSVATAAGSGVVSGYKTTLSIRTLKTVHRRTSPWVARLPRSWPT